MFSGLKFIIRQIAKTMPEYHDEIEMWKRSSSFQNIDIDINDKTGEEEFNKLSKDILRQEIIF